MVADASNLYDTTYNMIHGNLFKLYIAGNYTVYTGY